MDDATQDTEQLEKQLSALLDQIEAATTNLVERIADDSPGLSYADLASIDEADEASSPEAGETDDAKEPGAEEEQPEVRETAQTDGQDAPDLESAVEEMLHQVVEQTDVASEKADELDAELARLGDELLAKDEDLPAGDIQAPAIDAPIVDATAIHKADLAPTLDEPDGVVEPAPPPPEPQDIDSTEAGRTRVAELDVKIVDPFGGTSEEVSTSSAPTARAPLPDAFWPRVLAILGIALEHAWRAARRLCVVVGEKTPVIWRGAKPRVIQVMAAMSRPLDGKPPMVRSAVGWVAIVTAFWAIVVLVYVVAIRDPAPPTPEQTEVEMGPFESMFQRDADED